MSFRNPFSRQSLSHQAFEAWGQSILLGAKRAEDERRKGDAEAGKDSHYCKHRHQMLLDLKDEGKASKSRNDKVHKHVVAYLKEQKRAGRFTESDVERALTGLREQRGKEFDVVELAQALAPILKLTDPTSLQPLKQAAAAQAAAARKALSALEAGPQPQRAGENKPRFAVAASTKEKNAADKQLVISYDNAWSAAKHFLDAIDARAGMPNPQNADTLCDRFNKMFAAWPVSSDLRMDSLPHDLLSKKWAELIEMGHQLNLLLEQRDQRDHEPEFHDEVRQQARLLKEKSADYIRALVAVGELLTHFPRYGTDPARREPILRFGHALVNFANALLDPGSEFVEIYQWAEHTAALAQTHKQAAQAARVEQQKAQAAQAAKAQEQAAQQAQAQALINQRLDAIHRMGELASESYMAFDAYLDPEHEDGKKLHPALTRLLAKDPRTKDLDLDSLHDTLFSDKPEEIEDMLRDLEAAVKQWQEASDADRLSAAKLVCELSDTVKRRIDAYLDQFDIVGQLLKRPLPELGLSSEAESRRQAAAQLMADYVNGLEYSEGSWVKNMDYARATYDAARADVDWLATMAVAGDVQDEGGLDAELSLPSTPRAPLSSSSRVTDVVPESRVRAIGRHRDAKPSLPDVLELESRAFADFAAFFGAIGARRTNEQRQLMNRLQEEIRRYPGFADVDVRTLEVRARTFPEYFGTQYLALEDLVRQRREGLGGSELDEGINALSQGLQPLVLDHIRLLNVVAQSLEAVAKDRVAQGFETDMGQVIGQLRGLAFAYGHPEGPTMRLCRQANALQASARRVPDDVLQMADEFIRELEEKAKADAAIRQKAHSGLDAMSREELAHMLNLSTPPLTPRPGRGLDPDLSPNALPRLPLRPGASFRRVDGASDPLR